MNGSEFPRWLRDIFIGAILIVGVVALLGLGGCAGFSAQGQDATQGMASYELERRPDGSCRVRVASGRQIEEGELEVGGDCSLKAGARGLKGDPSAALGVAQEALRLLAPALGRGAP